MESTTPRIHQTRDATAHAVVTYHWWQDETFGEERTVPPYQNLRVPITLSIATLRAQNPTIPIKILDFSEYPEDWGCFPEKLNFEVINADLFLKDYSHIAGYRQLSRIFDIRRHFTSGTVIYCDSDVFWFKDPLPLNKNPQKFCYDGYNSGFFYYNPEDNQEIIDIFEKMTFRVLEDPEFHQVVKKFSKHDFWSYIWDESILHYMMFIDYRNYFDRLDLAEHTFCYKLKQTPLQNMKMLHGNGLMVSNPVAKRESEKEDSRGLACLVFSEFYQSLKKVLSLEEIQMIFTQQELDYYLPHQYSLVRDFARLDRTRRPGDPWHRYLIDSLNPAKKLWF